MNYSQETLEKAGFPTEMSYNMIQEIIYKCGSCNVAKNIEEFIKNKTCKNGYSHVCKVCSNKKSKNWKQKNSVRIAKRRRELYKLNLENNNWSKNHILEKELQRKYKNPYRMRAIGMQGNLREKQKMGIFVDPFLRNIFWLEQLLRRQPTCMCCTKQLDYNSFKRMWNNDSPTLDRFIPSLGYTRKNIRILCWRCNNLKRDATSSELRQIADWMDLESWGNEI